MIDTGVGIAKEKQFTLFKLFEKIQTKDYNSNEMGIGLGLTIAKKMVEMMNGAISFKSEVG